MKARKASYRCPVHLLLTDLEVILPLMCEGVLETDPCFTWNQQLLGGIGVTADIPLLYKDMHAYLKGTA